MENGEKWSWRWPNAGPTPINQGLDSEMFDRTDYPYSETFVREAIQNSLDARLDLNQPVRVNFFSHDSKLNDLHLAFLTDVFEYRKKAGLDVPKEWDDGKISWLVVQDFNSQGLSGDLSKRTSDFWNYWLNFGLSNKDGSGRGGRGIGRVTFLIASRINTVLGYTRRFEDSNEAACGMSVLRAVEFDNEFHSTHAYLAFQEYGSIYKLHNSDSFHKQSRKAFSFDEYGESFSSGLALAIPYPHDELQSENILAAAIENFAPAIINGSIEINVNDITLNKNSIDDIAKSVFRSFNNEAIQSDARRFLSLIRHGVSGDTFTKIKCPQSEADIQELRQLDRVGSLQRKLDLMQFIVLDSELSLDRYDKENKVLARAVLGITPTDSLPIDCFFREGMCLPDVKAKNPGEIDVVLLVDDKLLATYLNFCEGKAHLDISENKEVLEKLKDAGFSSGPKIKRIIRRLPIRLRALFSPDIEQPVPDVFASFFSVKGKTPGKKVTQDDSRPDINPEVPPLPEPSVAPFKVNEIASGLKVCTNPEFSEWPINVDIRLAYADGSRRPSWSKYDFLVEEMNLFHKDCKIVVQSDDRIRAVNCGPDFLIEIVGFDTNRELDTSIRWE